jgi:D-alanyl-D-alanine carboxypeptidase/D-alanyl-D-alanine-endopeptidase (penicillin-binding protein 4)
MPINSLFTFINSCTTITAGSKRELAVTKRLSTNILEIRGTMPAGDVKGFAGAIAVEKPAEMFLYLLKNALAQKGVIVTGQNKVIGSRDKAGLAVAGSPSLIEITRYESLPLSYVAAKTLKPSQNLYTELVLRALGEQAGDKTDPKLTSAERGLAVVQKFLAEAGIAPEAIVQFDGSGLSRHNLITPAATVQLYSFMSKHRFAAAFQAALPIGGVDGTLKSRFLNSLAVNNVRAKTGTIDQVSTLSGYLTTAAGERLVFSILTNNLSESALRRQTIDDIVIQLANFNGKTLQ